MLLQINDFELAMSNVSNTEISGEIEEWDYFLVFICVDYICTITLIRTLPLNVALLINKRCLSAFLSKIYILMHIAYGEILLNLLLEGKPPKQKLIIVINLFQRHVAYNWLYK